MNDATIDISGSEDELLKTYSRSSGRSDDAAAMQTAVCVLLAAVLFAAGFFFPEPVSQIINRIRELSASSNELFPNPILFIERLF